MATVAAGPAQRLNELTLDFLAYLELERGLSRNTLEAYRSDLQQLGEFLGRHGVDPLAVDAALLSEFVSELAEGRDDRRPAAASTLQRKVACLRSFYRHMRREGLLDTDPTRDVRPPRSRARLPRVLSRDQVNRLLEQPTGHKPRGAARSRAARDDVRLRPARLGGDHTEAERTRPRGRRADRPRQGLEGTDRAGRAQGARDAARVPGQGASGARRPAR